MLNADAANQEAVALEKKTVPGRPRVRHNGGIGFEELLLTSSCVAWGSVALRASEIRRGEGLVVDLRTDDIDRIATLETFNYLLVVPHHS